MDGHTRLSQAPITARDVCNWVTSDPPVITFQVLDQTFSTPRVSGCGPAAAELNRRFGLPSPSGENQLSGTAFYSFKTYDQL